MNFLLDICFTISKITYHISDNILIVKTSVGYPDGIQSVPRHGARYPAVRQDSQTGGMRVVQRPQGSPDPLMPTRVSSEGPGMAGLWDCE